MMRACMRKDEADIGEGVWLMLYDFKGVKPNPRFWWNLKRLIGLAGDGVMLQYSVFMTRSRRGAMAVDR